MLQKNSKKYPLQVYGFCEIPLLRSDLHIVVFFCAQVPLPPFSVFDFHTNTSQSTVAAVSIQCCEEGFLVFFRRYLSPEAIHTVPSKYCRHSILTKRGNSLLSEDIHSRQKSGARIESPRKSLDVVWREVNTGIEPMLNLPSWQLTPCCQLPLPLPHKLNFWPHLFKSIREKRKSSRNSSLQED